MSADDTTSSEWRQQFIATYLERDLPQLGIRVPAPALRRFWTMCAHLHGEPLNMQRLAESMGVSGPTVRHYVDILTQAFLLRQVEPYAENVGKRLVRAPRVYVRDSGIVHALLEIPTLDKLSSHPVVGKSFEGWVLDQTIAVLGPRWRVSYFRTAAGAELDFVFSRGNERIAVECKASAAPALTKGFWSALADVTPQHTWVVCQTAESYPLKHGVQVAPLPDFLRAAAQLAR